MEIGILTVDEKAYKVQGFSNQYGIMIMTENRVIAEIFYNDSKKVVDLANEIARRCNSIEANIEQEAKAYEIGIICAIAGGVFVQGLRQRSDIKSYKDAAEVIWEASHWFYEKWKKQIHNPEAEWETICAKLGVPGYDDLIMKDIGGYLDNKYGVT
jgi:hypothetical protein